MKTSTTLKTSIATILLCIYAHPHICTFAQNVGISATGITPNASAGLDVDFNNKGLLIPRMTTTERDAIASPAISLLIFNTTSNCLQIYNTISSVWESIYCFSSCVATPSAPTANAAGNITTTSFSANWTTVTAATAYYLDVATDVAFTNILSYYRNINVGNISIYTITGLNCGTPYYYRVRANNSCGMSTNSNTITVTTNGATTYINDDFSTWSQGWANWMEYDGNCTGTSCATSKYYTSLSLCCQSLYSISQDGTTGSPTAPSALISGDGSSFGINAGISKSISISNVCSSITLSLKYRATSTLASTTNAFVRLVNVNTNTTLADFALVSGGTTDTGWLSFSQNISAYLSGVTSLQIILYTSDGWLTNYNKTARFDTVLLQ